MSENQRNRGRILTPAGLHKLQQAIRAWEIQQGIRCTQEKIRELSDAFKEGGLDPGTIRKILEAKESVDRKSIQCLFQTFGLQPDEAWMTAAQGKLQSDPNFVGRDGAIADLDTLVSRDNRVIVIQARGGVGKTTLARKYLQQKFDAYLEFPIAKETKDIASIESLIEEKLRQLGEEPGREFFVSLDRLKRKLQAERIGILIDNLEPALDAAGKLIEPHRRYVELLRVLADPSVRAVTLITSRERLNEYSISMQHYLLSELSLAAWTQFFQNRLSLFASDRAVSAADHAALAALHKAYGGNAKAMDILCGAVLTDYSGKLAAYWQANQDDLLIERALEDLVVGQFDRLQTLNPDAYKLLCRLGCYRYQDVPTVPIAGLLCLLWDVPENRQKRVIKALQERSLVEFAEGEYWLHPVIRGEAIDRLRGAEDLETTNQRVAEFWIDNTERIEGLEDGIKAFEGFYHYLEINDFEKAGDAILRERGNKWIDNSLLIFSLLRLGLLKQSLSAINQIIDKINFGYTLIRLQNVLGTLYWLTGQVNKAIEYHQKSQELTFEYLKSNPSINNDVYLKMLRIKTSSLLNLGLCMLDLWELEKALLFFQKAKKAAEDDGYVKHLNNSLFCLAFLNSCVGRLEMASHFAEKSELSSELTEWGAGNKFLFLGQTYKNLSQLERAYEMYQQAILYAEDSNYSQVKAKALCGMAELKRKQKNFQECFIYYFEAIEILDGIGAKCDLAEAYYQIGLTCQAMGEIEKSNESFQEAIRLFGEMEAPRQVERVRRSMENQR